jgi:hypothetical protein
MKHYRVNIFAKGRRGAEIYQAKPIEGEDEASAKAVAEAVRIVGYSDGLPASSQVLRIARRRQACIFL